jgi:TfoX-like protein
MKMPKPDQSDLDRFRSLVPDGPGVEVKPMFGQLAAFVNGNMFAGLFGSAVGVKLSDDAAEELSDLPGSGPFGPEERPMGGYLALSPDMDDEQAAAWLDRAREHVSTFPPKKKR